MSYLASSEGPVFLGQLGIDSSRLLPRLVLTAQCKLSAASSSLQKGAVKCTSPFQQYVDPGTPSFDLSFEVVRTGLRATSSILSFFTIRCKSFSLVIFISIAHD